MRRAGPLVVLLPPMSEVRPADLVHPSNELNYDSAYVVQPDLIAARRAIRNWELSDWCEDIGAGRPMLVGPADGAAVPANYAAYVLAIWDSLEWTALLKVLRVGGRALGLDREPGRPALRGGRGDLRLRARRARFSFLLGSGRKVGRDAHPRCRRRAGSA